MAIPPTGRPAAAPGSFAGAIQVMLPGLAVASAVDGTWPLRSPTQMTFESLEVCHQGHDCVRKRPDRRQGRRRWRSGRADYRRLCRCGRCYSDRRRTTHLHPRLADGPDCSGPRAMRFCIPFSCIIRRIAVVGCDEAAVSYSVDDLRILVIYNRPQPRPRQSPGASRSLGMSARAGARSSRSPAYLQNVLAIVGGMTRPGSIWKKRFGATPSLRLVQLLPPSELVEMPPSVPTYSAVGGLGDVPQWDFGLNTRAW